MDQIDTNCIKLSFMVTINQHEQTVHNYNQPRRLINSGHWLGFLRRNGDGPVDDGSAFSGSLAASIGSKSWRHG